MRQPLAITAAVLLTLVPAPGRADTVDRLLALVSIAGVSGYERDVRAAVEMLMPGGARVRADNLGNILIGTGNGAPHTLIVAPLDESGLVVSAITDDGYLRVHRHTSAGPRLATQYLVGQPMSIRTASGTLVPGVSATPSSHLRALGDPQSEARIKTLDDVWIDVGATSRSEVEALGVRLLDSVTLRERAVRLAGTRVSGVAAANRAGTLAVAELIRRSTGRGATGSVTLAWATQSEYGQRGLLRLLDTLRPDRVILVGGAPSPADDPRGAAGRLGGGPIVVEGDAWLAAAASSASVAVQAVPSARLRVALPNAWKGVAVHRATVPVLFAQTPVETVDARDVDTLAALVAASVGLGPLSAPGAQGAMETGGATAVSGAGPATGAAPATDPFATLAPLIEAAGVSGHEQPVREQVLSRLPPWATPDLDERGNITVSFGRGETSLLFVAHLDEVGFEVTSIASDGTASVRPRGGMYLSLYESHPLVLSTPGGGVPALLAPRAGYAGATEAQPAANTLAMYFGTDSAAETAALGVAAGQAATVRKQFARLGAHRATGRAMDDRVGSAALLLALQRIDPKRVANDVTFAWTVEEETGLTGAAHLAERMRPDTVFAIDTFVSTDTPVDIQRVAGARLGGGAVLRILDSRTIVPPHIVDGLLALARTAKIPLQLGTTSGGTDASAFSAGGAVDVGLSWPGRYSHSPVEVMDVRDLDALIRLIVAVATTY
ncbi:MAG: M20/M25/M40 family metallo-hydrolase [Acidobacteriota bacterium]